MKQVLIPEPTPTKAFIGNLNYSKFYGILNRGQRHFLSCSSDGKRAQARYLKGFTYGDGHTIHETTAALLRPLIEEGEKWRSGVFEFDTLVELALWLEGKDNYEVVPKRSHKKKPAKENPKVQSATHFAAVIHPSTVTDGNFYCIRKGKVGHTHLYLTKDGEWKSLSEVSGNMRNVFHFGNSEIIHALLEKQSK